MNGFLIMGFNKKIDVTSDFLYQHLSDFDILYAYRNGDLEIGTIESSAFREDQHASCGFYYNDAGRLIYNDIATSEKLGAVAYVAKLKKISFKAALVKIADEFGLTGLQAKYHKVDPDKIEIKKKEEKIIKVVPDAWSKSYVDYWQQFHLSQTDVEADVIPIKTLYIDGKMIPNYSKSIRFAYPITLNGKTWYKIYIPYAKEYKWINNIPIYIPFGVESLPLKGETLIITKSAKDRLIWKQYFPYVLGLQNESPAALRDITIEKLKQRFENIYINTDLDTAGKQALQYFVDKGLKPAMLPDVFYTKHNIKDTAELVAEFGMEKFESFLKYIKLK